MVRGRKAAASATLGQCDDLHRNQVGQGQFSADPGRAGRQAQSPLANSRPVHILHYILLPDAVENPGALNSDDDHVLRAPVARSPAGLGSIRTVVRCRGGAD
ncbi:hypothetical protein D9M68_743610 [compost metagenome]